MKAIITLSLSDIEGWDLHTAVLFNSCGGRSTSSSSSVSQSVQGDTSMNRDSLLSRRDRFQNYTRRSHTEQGDFSAAGISSHWSAEVSLSKELSLTSYFTLYKTESQYHVKVFLLQECCFRVCEILNPPTSMCCWPALVQTAPWRDVSVTLDPPGC